MFSAPASCSRDLHMPSVCWAHKAYLYTRQLLEQPARSQLGLENSHVLIFVFRMKMGSSSLLVALEILTSKISSVFYKSAFCRTRGTGKGSVSQYGVICQWLMGLKPTGAGDSRLGERRAGQPHVSLTLQENNSRLLSHHHVHLSSTITLKKKSYFLKNDCPVVVAFGVTWKQLRRKSDCRHLPNYRPHRTHGKSLGIRVLNLNACWHCWRLGR